MKTMKNIFILLTLTMSNIICADIYNLSKGIMINDTNVYQLAKTSYEYARARKAVSQNNESGLTAFLKVPSTTDLFSLSSDTKLYHSNFETKILLGHWPIPRWSHEYIPAEIRSRLSQEGTYLLTEKPHVGKRSKGEIYSGCLSKTPLRFGDINSNSLNELVLLFDQDIVIFSPDTKKNIFQLRWIDERIDGDYEDANGPIVSDPDDKILAPQYRDPYVNGPLYKGLRGFSKMYIGEFNNNQTPDIIVWYKVYQSNMDGETKGFSKVSDTVRHYELITEAVDEIQPTGEYLPLNTSEAEIRQWLTSNTLTWQKGYPNLSECAGQTTQHIPEMVDPLLNDPDVLK